MMDGLAIAANTLALARSPGHILTMLCYVDVL